MDGKLDLDTNLCSFGIFPAIQVRVRVSRIGMRSAEFNVKSRKSDIPIRGWSESVLADLVFITQYLADQDLSKPDVQNLIRN